MRKKQQPESVPTEADAAEENRITIQGAAEQGRTAASDTPVVGIGASAGGLEAFKLLLTHLPPDAGFAVVLIQHLNPAHHSILSEILARTTSVPVGEAADGMAVEPNHVYVT